MAKVVTSFGTLALLPFPAEAPMRETLEWKTDLHESHNGTQKSIQLRNHPRQTLHYSIPETHAGKVRAYIDFYGAFKLKWAVPLWGELQHIGTIAFESQTINCNTTLYDLRVNSLALLWQSNDVWQLVEISAMDGSSITITGLTIAYQNAYLIPVRIGRITGNVSLTSAGYQASTDVKFEIEDNLALAGVVPTQFLADDLYTDPTLFRDTSIDGAVQSRTDRIDYELGVTESRYPWTYNRTLRPRHMLAEGPTEVRALRGWLMRRAGRFRRYWEPTFENDLRNASTGTVTNALRVIDDGHNDWSARPHIAVLSGGVWLCRTVTGVGTPTLGVLELSIDSNLNIQASSIKAISFLGLRRLDTDRVELNWLGNSVVRATVNTVEIQP